MECSIINPALSLLMKHLVIGQRQEAPNLSAFHWSPHSNLVSIGQHFVTTRVVHLPKRTETTLITKSDLITESNQAVRAVHICNSGLCLVLRCSFSHEMSWMRSGTELSQFLRIFLFTL